MWKMILPCREEMFRITEKTLKKVFPMILYEHTQYFLLLFLNIISHYVSIMMRNMLFL